MNKVLLEFLSKTLSLDENGVTSLFNEDGSPKDDSLQKFLDLDAARVARLQKGKFDEGVKKATKEVMSKFETELKTKHGIDSDKVGVDLVSEIIETKTPKGDGLTEDQVTKSKWYLDLKENQDKAIKEAVKKEKEIHETYKSQIERKEVISKVKATALTILDELKPVLSQDSKKAAKQKEFFLKEIEAGRFRLDGDRIILMKEDGTEETDEHGNRKDFNQYAKDIASSYYDFAQSDPKGSPGNQGGNGGQGGSKIVIKSDEDYQKQYLAAKDSKEKAEIYTAYEEFKKSSPGS